MRKFFAISMLVVYLFNLTGYRIFFRYYMDQSSHKIARQADASNYNEAELTEIKIKLNLPYVTDWSAYERFDGEIELEGRHYNYVKRKVARDTLYLLCLPNEIKTKLSAEKNEYAAKVNDIPAGKDNANSLSKKNTLLNEFSQQAVLFDFSLAATVTYNRNSYNSTELPEIHPDCTGQPPEWTC